MTRKSFLKIFGLGSLGLGGALPKVLNGKAAEIPLKPEPIKYPTNDTPISYSGVWTSYSLSGSYLPSTYWEESQS